MPSSPPSVIAVVVMCWLRRAAFLGILIGNGLCGEATITLPTLVQLHDAESNNRRLNPFRRTDSTAILNCCSPPGTGRGRIPASSSWKGNGGEGRRRSEPRWRGGGDDGYAEEEEAIGGGDDLGVLVEEGDGVPVEAADE